MSASLRVTLFGKFSACYQNQQIDDWKSIKVRELLSYLLLNPYRNHRREILATLLWGNYCNSSQATSYLRKTIWLVKRGIQDKVDLCNGNFFQSESGWAKINLAESIWIDALVFDKIYQSVEGVPCVSLAKHQVLSLEKAIDIYKGDLLEGWEPEWCFLERERYRQKHLILLDKLAAYYEAQHAFEKALKYSTIILSMDSTREYTHRQIMRLYYTKGDRTLAMRQYDKCATILAQELNVLPSSKTRALYEEITLDQQTESEGLKAVYHLPANQGGKQEVADLNSLMQELNQLQKRIQAYLLTANYQDNA